VPELILRLSDFAKATWWIRLISGKRVVAVSAAVVLPEETNRSAWDHFLCDRPLFAWPVSGSAFTCSSWKRSAEFGRQRFAPRIVLRSRPRPPHRIATCGHLDSAIASSRTARRFRPRWSEPGVSFPIDQMLTVGGDGRSRRGLGADRRALR